MPLVLNQGTPEETTLRVVLESEELSREFFDHHDSLNEMLDAIRNIVEEIAGDGIERVVGIAIVPVSEYGSENGYGYRLNRVSKPKLTAAQINFFEVEIRNEDEGGVSPATLFSAYDSLVQAPDDVIESWCDDDAVRTAEPQSFRDFVHGVKLLMDQHGADTTLESLLSD